MFPHDIETKHVKFPVYILLSVNCQKPWILTLTVVSIANEVFDTSTTKESVLSDWLSM